MNRIDEMDRTGFALVEAVIAVALFTMIFGATFGLVVSGSRSAEVGITSDQLRNRVRESMGEIAEDLRGARIIPSITPGQIRFKKLTGAHDSEFEDFDFTDVRVLWDEIPESRYTWIISPNEVANGQDDDGDGLVDEGQIEKATGGVTATILTNVPKNGFEVLQIGPKKHFIRLSLEKTDRQGEVVRAEASATIFLRN